MKNVGVLLCVVFLLSVPYLVRCAEDEPIPVVEEDIRADMHGSRTAEAHEEAEHFSFQAEVSRLLNIIINSLYTKKEIFLREVISNASDALDKIRFLSLTETKKDAGALDIHIHADKEERLLHIRDRGIGMTHDDLVDSLGTIASSGTRGFLDQLQEAGGDLNLIGQFGVGFYSVYLVADRVKVTTKHDAEERQLVWESSAEDSYEIYPDPQGNTLERGTQITLHLREDAKEFLEEDRLQELVHRYSEFINFPIYIQVSKEVEREVEDEDAGAAEEEEVGLDDDEETTIIEDGADGEGEKKEKKTVKETVTEWVQANENSPIWTRNPKEISEEEYQNFYSAISKEYDNATAHVHFSAEGDISFRSILFVPGHAPADVATELNRAKSAIKLYVRRVFISDEMEDILPRYLSFLRGVVDSDDLPLNLSREFLQQSRLIRMLRKKLVRKALDMIREMADAAHTPPKDDEESEVSEPSESGDESDIDEPRMSAEERREAYVEAKEKYERFWKDFGVFLRIGVIEDTSNRNRIARLLMFESTKTTEERPFVTLQQYVNRMKKGQKSIYYIAGENINEVRESPMLEELRNRGLEVLFMVDAVDEYVLQSYTEFEGHKFVDVSKEGLKLEGGDEDDLKKTETELKTQFKPLTEWLETTLGSDRIATASVGMRIRQSPCVLVAGQWGLTANMERILKAQAVGEAGGRAMKARRIFEVNPHHPIIVEMLHRVEADSEDPKLKELAELLYDTAAMQSGFSVEDMNTFADRVYGVVKLGLSLDAHATVTDEQIESGRTDALQAALEREEREEEEKAELEDDAVEGEEEDDELTFDPEHKDEL